MPQIAVSIINYKTADLTLACVSSVLADLDGVDAVAVIVDNFSDDGSVARIEEWIAAHPQGDRVKLVASPVNTGFSGGHNLGIQAVEADLYVLLNSDALLRPGFLKAMLDAAEHSPEAGFFAPQLQGEDGETQNSSFRFAGPVSEFIRSARTGIVTRLFKRYEVALGPAPDPEQVDWVSFACVVLRRQMIKDLGLMDEGYFLYFEDAEYCLRAKRQGWKIALVPQAVAVHFRGGSGPVKSLARENKRMPAYYYASRTRFLYQAHGWVGLIGANLLWHAGRVLAQSRRLVGKPVNPVNAGEARDIWINATTPLGPRRAPGE